MHTHTHIYIFLIIRELIPCMYEAISQFINFTLHEIFHEKAEKKSKNQKYPMMQLCCGEYFSSTAARFYFRSSRYNFISACYLNEFSKISVSKLLTIIY